MNLTESITIQTNRSLTKMTFAQVESLGIVLAAARAANCERCHGRGKLFSISHASACPECKDDRKKAGIV